MYVALRQVLETKDWSAAFDRNGFSVGQMGVKVDRLKTIGTCVLAVSCERPTLAQLQTCFPRRRKVKAAVVWRCADAVGKVKAAAASSASSSASGGHVVADVKAAPIASRTRARCKTTPLL